MTDGEALLQITARGGRTYGYWVQASPMDAGQRDSLARVIVRSWGFNLPDAR